MTSEKDTSLKEKQPGPIVVNCSLTVLLANSASGITDGESVMILTPLRNGGASIQLIMTLEKSSITEQLPDLLKRRTFHELGKLPILTVIGVEKLEDLY